MVIERRVRWRSKLEIRTVFVNFFYFVLSKYLFLVCQNSSFVIEMKDGRNLQLRSTDSQDFEPMKIDRTFGNILIHRSFEHGTLSVVKKSTPKNVRSDSLSNADIRTSHRDGKKTVTSFRSCYSNLAERKNPLWSATRIVIKKIFETFNQCSFVLNTYTIDPKFKTVNVRKV